MLILSRSLLVSMFHTLKFSLQTEKIWSGLCSLKCRLVMGELSALVWVMLWKFSRSQYLIVRSVEPLARVSVIGLNSIVVTFWLGISKFSINLLFLRSQILSVPSLLPDAIHFPSGDYLIALIESVCSLKVATCLACLWSQLLTLASWPPVKR